MPTFSLRRFSPLLIAFCLFASALMPCHAQATYIPDVQKLINQSIPRAAGYAYKPGRIITTDFTNQAATNNDFTLTNLAYTTDGSSVACIQANNMAVTDASRPVSTLLTKDRFRDCEVFLKMKLVSDATFGTGQPQPSVTARYTDANNNVITNLNPSGATYYSGTCFYNGAQGASTPNLSPVTLSLTDTTNYIYERIRIVQNYCSVKVWNSTQAEPDWQESNTLSNSNGSMVGIGSSGATVRYSASRIYQITVTELLRADDNLLHNADLSLIDSTGTPIWWTRKSDAGNTSTIENIADRFGVVRPAFKVITGGVLWDQSLSSATNGRSASAPYTLTPYPQSVLSGGPYLEFSCWTKGINLVNTTGINGAVFVMYYGDYNNNAYNVTAGLTDYVCDFNNGIPGTSSTYGKGQVGTGTGLGTWDWTLTKFRFPLHTFSGVVQATPDIGIHDNNCTGTVYMQDPCLRFVP